MISISDETFTKKDFTKTPLESGEYDNCVFSSCIFYESRLTEISFLNCVFNDCDLSLAKIENTAFREVEFNSCKMVGIDFEQANGFGLRLSFKNSNLSHAVFFQKDIRKTVFDHCILRETDFTEANLTESKFTHSDLSGSIFDRTHLEKADFREALNFSIIPENNFMKKARFSQHNLAGLLMHSGIEIS